MNSIRIVVKIQVIIPTFYDITLENNYSLLSVLKSSTLSTKEPKSLIYIDYTILPNIMQI